MENTKKKSIQEIMAKNRADYPYTVGELCSELEFLIARSSNEGWTLKKTTEELGFIYKRAKKEGEVWEYIKDCQRTVIQNILLLFGESVMEKVRVESGQMKS